MNQKNGYLSQQATNLTDLIANNKQNSKTEGFSSKAKEVDTNLSFDQPVILRQSPIWSHAILWTIISVTTGGLIWAGVTEIEQAVPAQGKLEPKAAVNEVKAPRGGVVTEIHVEDGQKVKKGDLLVTLEPKTAQAQLTSLSKVRAALIKENQFYRSQMRNSTALADTSFQPSELSIPQEIISLTESRNALLAENELYRTQLRGDTSGTRLSPAQRERLQFATRELNSRISSYESEIRQLEKRLDQNKVQLANAQEILQVEQGILRDLELLLREGAFSRIQYLRQENEVKTRQAELEQLVDEELRLQLDIDQAKEQLINTVALSQKELTDKIAANQQEIARIDSDLNKRIVDNEKQLAEIDSQLSETNLALAYQELRSPVSGTVFDLQASAEGFVTNSAEPVLKVVPDEALIAKVYLTNKDIGFVQEGMTVDVRVEAFPFSEFGDIKGELVSIGSDALPPSPAENRPFYTFPASIKLDQQSLEVNDRQLPLQSGMSVNANILIRKRTVLSLFNELFTEKMDSLKTVR
ncbi:MAG: HlyD family efflux transporter periplasmic adaptor subunit [Coleofasciculaceae cyanobacterium]